ncbi:MAG: HD domain-containing protein [Vicingaceae bacterium]
MDFKNAKKYILERLEKDLSPNLYYHGVHHTIDVYESAIKIAELENLDEDEKMLVKTAALYHDTGFLFEYHNNEKLAIKLVNQVLPKFSYNKKQLQVINDIISSTQLKAKPNNLLQKIMNDADSDYLGRKDVGKIANTLYEELKLYGVNYTAEEWVKVQLNFLEKHQYYTKIAIKLREPEKLAYCNYLKSHSK